MPVQGLLKEMPAENLLISRLQEAAQARGLNPEALAEQLEVSLQTLRGWQHGTVPSPANRAKIEKFLDSQTAPTAAAEQPVKSGQPAGTT
jgi:ribosome-binding protein aMBF1 (putative translation factor)